MSLAEDLLNTLNDGGANDNTESNDVEEPIIVDEKRRIIVPNKLKTIAVMGDKNVETVTFKCIRYWDAVHDLSNFVIYINYILPNGTTGTYIPEIKGIFDDYFTFDWLIGREITKYNGSLTFLILARRTDNEGKLEYQWSSLLNSECTIAQGLEIINVTDDEEAEDRLTSLLEKYEQLSKLPDEVNKKLDKKTEPTDGTYVYAIKDGEQTVVKASSEANGDHVMCRDKDGRSHIAEPKEDTHIANKEYVDTVASGKLDQDTSVTDNSKAYVKTPDGTQTTVDISSTGMPGAIVALDENGQSKVDTPTEDAHIANKKYVDDELAKFDFIKVVPSLDAVANPLPNRIYLVPNENADTQNLFDEWIFVNGKWEWITTKEIDVDLTEYATIEYVDSTMEDTSDALDEIIEIQNTLVDDGNPNTSWLIDKIYPVGSIYMSVNDVDPEVIFGGTWEQIQGRFLLGTGSGYGLGAMGGAESVTLTENQMPRHNHNPYLDTFKTDSFGQYIDNAGSNTHGIAPTGGYTEGKRVGTLQITATGGGQPHNNMPPYLAVNMWKRTA